MRAFNRQPEDECLAIRGRKLRTVRWRAAGGSAAAPPLLFFAGLAGNVELLAPFLETMDDRDVVTFDMPGIGGSPPDGGPYRPSTMASAAREILDRFGYARADVMGFSWGGIIAQQFAAQHRERTRRLILAGTSPGSTMVPGKPSALPFMLDPRKFSDPAFLWRRFGTIYGGGNRGWDEFYQGVRKPTGRGYAYQLLALWGWTGLPLLPTIKAPTLIVAGEEDNLVPMANAHILKFLLPNARLHRIAGAGHMFLLTAAEESRRAIVDFLDAAGESAPSAQAGAAAA